MTRPLRENPKIRLPRPSGDPASRRRRIHAPGAAIEGALARPLGAPALARFIEPGDSVTVVLQGGAQADLRGLVLPRLEAAIAGAGASSLAVLTSRAPAPWNPDAPAARGPEAGDAPVRYEPLGWLRVPGGPAVMVRVAAQVAFADKLVLAGEAGGDPDPGHAGGASLVVPGCADPGTIRGLLRAAPGAMRGLAETALDLAPPAFLLQLGGPGRQAAVFAGDPRQVIRAATAPLLRGRGAGGR